MTTLTAQRPRVTRRGLEVGLAFVRYLERTRKRVEDHFARQLTDVFDDMGRAAARAYNARKVADPLVDAIVSDMDISGIRRRLHPMYGGTYQSAATLVMNGVADILSMPISIGLRDQIAERVLAEGGRRVGLVDLAGQTRDAVFAALEEARAEGLGIPQTARRIRDYVSAGRYTVMEQAREGAGSAYRATLIARTETRYATNVSVSQTGRAMGFEHYLAFDDRLGFGDAECVARDGQVFTADEMDGEISAEHPQGTLSFSPIPRTEVSEPD